jgi:hypothetical protein
MSSDQTPQRPTSNDDREGWKAYWVVQGMPWRTEPEIDEERQVVAATPGARHLLAPAAVRTEAGGAALDGTRQREVHGRGRCHHACLHADHGRRNVRAAAM